MTLSVDELRRLREMLGEAWTPGSWDEIEGVLR